MSTAEQLCPHCGYHHDSVTYRRFLKKVFRRRRRRLEKRDPENAPKRNRYLGYSD